MRNKYPEETLYPISWECDVFGNSPILDKNSKILKSSTSRGCDDFGDSQISIRFEKSWNPIPPEGVVFSELSKFQLEFNYP